MDNKITIHKESEYDKTIRVELLSSMFEVPLPTKLAIDLGGEVDLSVKPWNIGLIVGPSGSGKTLLLNELFGTPPELEWRHKSVIDDFESEFSMESISRVCQSVGFNTIPSWLRPYSVLSNGEKFRVSTARSLIRPGTIRIDEFTSVVDRQVAQFASHAVQKFVRESDRQLVAASCHYDIIDWLQPDWILEPGNPCKLSWRSLQRRPPIAVTVCRVKYNAWELFKNFHYMSADLNRAARCYGLFVKASEGLGLQYNDDDVHSHPNGSGDNSRDDRGPRIPGSSILSQRSSDSSVVFRQANGVEDSGRIQTESESIQRTDSSSSEEADIQQSSRRSGMGIERGAEERRFSVCNKSAPNESLATSTDEKFDNMVGTTQMDGSLRRYRIASMCGVLHRPHPKVSDICGFTRMVTLPDFQGLGLAFVLACKVASAYKALGKRLHSYPNHPAWIRSYQRSSLWMQVKDSGTYSPRRGSTSTVGGFGNKRCAVFQYLGPAMNFEEARRLVYGEI